MTLVIIPAFNTEGTLPELLRRLALIVDVNSILVVDDGSVDRTAAVAAGLGVRVIQHRVNKGKGAALKTGFEYARTLPRCEAVVTLDADLQHVPEELPKFFEARMHSPANIIIGFRERLGTSMPFHRIASNALTSWLVSARVGKDIRDSQSGYRLIGREVLDAVTLDSQGYEMETELLVKATRKGFRVGFVPIRTVYGTGRSSMTHWHTTKQFLRILLKEE